MICQVPDLLVVEKIDELQGSNPSRFHQVVGDDDKVHWGQKLGTSLRVEIFTADELK